MSLSVPGWTQGMPMAYPPANMAEDRLSRLRRLNAPNEQEIRTHEYAHQSKAGPHGGSPVWEYDGNGILVGGHVPISIPALNAQDPAKSYQAYQMISDAAYAPDKPSSQDRQVGMVAQSLMGQAQVLMNQKQQQTPLKSI